MGEFKEDSHPLAGLDPVIHSQGRLMVLTYLYVVDQADYKFLQNLTSLTWGNLATHIGKLEEAGYVEVEKKFVGKKPHSMVKMTKKGRAAFRGYKRQMQEVLNNLPE